MPLQAVEKRPSAALSGRLTVSVAWQKVAPYSSRRTFKYASLLRISPAYRRQGYLASGIFDQSAKNDLFNRLFKLDNPTSLQ
jgi:hypothetical protein